MRPFLAATMLSLLACQPALAQQTICINGHCYPVVQPQPIQNQSIGTISTLTLVPLEEEVDIEGSQLETATRDEDRFDQIIRATVRVTVSGVCGSGTVVGRDSAGNALVLTNAHVAGTSRGRTVNVERWELDGTSERGQGAIIAAGYGRGMSVDFALLKCNSEFAKDVTPIPLVDRYPEASASITTFGCPRCEWPSLQVLKLNRSEGQVLTWKPEAIGGRSGSSVMDHTDAGPRIVGLLTWGGGGEGLGQSTPFLLNAMRGRLPTSLETLPIGVREVAHIPKRDEELYAVCQVPATTTGQPLAQPLTSETGSETPDAQVDEAIIDSITEEGLRDRLRPKPDDAENGLLNRDRNPGLIGRGLEWFRRLIITVVIAASCGLIGFFIGRFWK